MDHHHLGSCLCGDVNFEIKGHFAQFFLCHCTHCQKDTGSAHAANLFSTEAKISWLKGEDKVKNFNLSGTRHCKSFCGQCGSALPSVQMDGKLLVVPAGSLDSELTQVPDAHIFYSSKAHWEENLQDIKKFEKLPQ